MDEQLKYSIVHTYHSNILAAAAAVVVVVAKSIRRYCWPDHNSKMVDYYYTLDIEQVAYFLLNSK